MLEPHYVAVFDPESYTLCRLPFHKIDPSNYDQIQIPRWRRQFDLYASKHHHPEMQAVNGTVPPKYAVISRCTDDPDGRSHLARLYYSRLGLISEVERLLSARYRTLYIGAIPS